MASEERFRCSWPAKHELAIIYHDQEWGLPVHDDIKHFEFMLLDAFQAGLSWNTILNKRENFRKAFDNFDFNIISQYTEDKVSLLLSDVGIVRNKLKIKATISNASAFIKIIEEYSSFDVYIWQFVNGKPINNNISELNFVPATSKESDAMSKALLKRGFRFVGSTICYAYMQAAGMVNDHMTKCFRHQELIKQY